MFGTLRPRLCQLSSADAASYRTFYCGGCKTLGDQYGQLSRATLSYEAVLLALVAEGLSDNAPQRSTCRCPMLPVIQRDIIAPATSSMQMAAAVQLIWTEQWLLDQQLDGARLTSLALPVLRPQVERARTDLSAAGFSLDAFEDLAHRQTALEQRKPDPIAAAEPTAHALASLLHQLPGVLDSGEAGQSVTGSSATLARLGYGIGRAIYWIDALRDLPTDLADRTFNPLVSGRRIDRARLNLCTDALSQTLAGIRSDVRAISWRQHDSLIQHLLCDELKWRAHRTIDGAHRMLASGGKRSRRRDSAACDGCCCCADLCDVIACCCECLTCCDCG